MLFLAETSASLRSQEKYLISVFIAVDTFLSGSKACLCESQDILLVNTHYDL